MTPPPTMFPPAARPGDQDAAGPSAVYARRPHETDEGYVERLRAAHRRLGAILEAAERALNDGDAPGGAVRAPIAPAITDPAATPAPVPEDAPGTSPLTRTVVRARVPGRPEGRRVITPLHPGRQTGWVERGAPRRVGPADRRLAGLDRRHGVRDRRPEEERVERRVAPRRSGVVDRRWLADRRRAPAPLQDGGPTLSVTLTQAHAFWAIQVVVWLAIAAGALALAR